MRKLRALAMGNRVAALALAAALWVSLFLYAGRPLVIAAMAGGVPAVAGWLGLVALSVVSLLPALVRRGDLLLKRTAVHWIGYALLGLFSTLLLLSIAGDLVRLLFFWIPINPRALAYSILAAALLLSLIGLFQARWPRVKRVRVSIENLPAELEAYRIVQCSDLHVGPTIRRPFVEWLVQRVNDLEPDAVAITGDLVDGYVEELREHVQPLANLRAKDGVYWVTGNHEYYWRASDWVEEFSRLGLIHLKNEHRLVRRGKTLLAIAGVTDPVGRYTHKQNPPGALAGVPPGAVKVLLSHRPQTARAAAALGVDLQLSGHTHGGQFFPFNLVIRRFQPVVAGLHRIGRTWLYVSRGTGYWGPPTRLGVLGEITMIELARAES